MTSVAQCIHAFNIPINPKLNCLHEELAVYGFISIAQNIGHTVILSCTYISLLLMACSGAVAAIAAFGKKGKARR